jgi:hypothetical protein
MHQTRRHDPRRAKERDMARSILPSTSRAAARRSLDAVRRRHRRQVNQQLAAWRDRRPCGCWDPGGDADDAELGAGAFCAREFCAGAFAGDACGDSCSDIVVADYPLSEHLEAISSRRNADKIAPLERWALRRVEEIRVELSVTGTPTGAEVADISRQLRALLPPGVIGWHAMSHLRWIIDEPWWRRPLDRPVRMTLAERLADLGRWALETGRHRQLNSVVRANCLAVGDDDCLFERIAGDDAARWTRTLGLAWRPLHGVDDLGRWAEAHARRTRWDGTSPVTDAIMRWAVTTGWRDPQPSTRRRR